MILTAALLLAHVGSAHVSMATQEVLGTPVRCITVNLNEPSVRLGIVLANGFPGSDEPFESIVARANPAAAVNGAYFSKDTLLPIGDIVVNGKLEHSGRMGTALTISDSGAIDIERVQRHKTYLWKGYKTVLACGPALMLDGNIDVQFELEGFRDPHVTGTAARMAVGYTPKRKLIMALIERAVSFQEEAKIMQALGCIEAMNLDAGASLAMAYGGKIIKPAGRRLTNVLAVWAD